MVNFNSKTIQCHEINNDVTKISWYGKRNCKFIKCCEQGLNLSVSHGFNLPFFVSVLKISLEPKIFSIYCLMDLISLTDLKLVVLALKILIANNCFTYYIE